VLSKPSTRDLQFERIYCIHGDYVLQQNTIISVPFYLFVDYFIFKLAGDK
jgi:hypothetical protein